MPTLTKLAKFVPDTEATVLFIADKVLSGKVTTAANIYKGLKMRV